MSIPRFIGRFLAVFALLVFLGGFLNATRGYALLLERAASIASPAINGWWMEGRAGPRGREIWLRREATQLKLQISLEKLGLGLLPLFSLLIATPGLGLKRLGIALASGFVGLVALDLVVVLAYPWLVEPGIVNDIAGTFLGLLTFVGGPVILWFVLTFRHLRLAWGLG